MAAFRAFRADDPGGAKEVAQVVGGLANNPEVPGAEPWGLSGYRRLRVGRYRVLYRIDASTITIYLVTLGRIPAE